MSKKKRPSAIEIIETIEEMQDELPYDEPIGKKDYERDLEALQTELLKAQRHIKTVGDRAIIVFEGRDAAGKGGSIKRFREHLNPRGGEHVALPKPTDAEQTQWYFQRYVAHLPSAGEITMFDRSWYNRAGVEKVMGFCTPQDHALFLRQVPDFEQSLVSSGIHLFKLWFTVSKARQKQRFDDRREDPLKQWGYRHFKHAFRTTRNPRHHDPRPHPPRQRPAPQPFQHGIPPVFRPQNTPPPQRVPAPLSSPASLTRLPLELQLLLPRR